VDRNETAPNAVIAPVSHAGPGDAATRLRRLQEEFAPILDVAVVHVRLQGSTHFLTGDPGDTLLFPQGSGRDGLPRYDWTDRGDGVSYGSLKTNA
jgi:hypothetical protein